MDIFDKARELGVMIASTEELAALKAAEEALERDEIAQKLLRDFQLAQKRLMTALKSGIENDRVNTLRQQYDKLKDEVDKCPPVKNFLDASSRFDNLMKQINDIITFMVSGQEDGGCRSGGCADCSGCNSR